jgi:multiple sugar transport system ATP-binding protein
VAAEHGCAGRVKPTPGIAISGAVGLVERLGHETFVELTTASGQAVTALVGGTTLVEIGQTMSLRFVPDDCLLFATDGTACPRTRVPEIAHMHMPLAA